LAITRAFALIVAHWIWLGHAKAPVKQSNQERSSNRTTTDIVRVAADIFSNTIREYSAGEHLPHAIMRRVPVPSSSPATMLVSRGAVFPSLVSGRAGAQRKRPQIAGITQRQATTPTRAHRRAHLRAVTNLHGQPTFPHRVQPKRNGAMADDRAIRGPQDRQRVNMSEDYEVAYWSKKWGVTREELAEAVRNAGPMAGAVAKHLGKEP
jgi:hypothetical protein